MKKTFKIVGISVIIIVLIGLISLIVFNSIYIRSKVSGDSMYPTLKASDRVFINKFEKGTINDIVVADITEESAWPHKDDGNYVIKRLIAKEGDRVKLEASNNFNITLFVNDKPISQTEVSVTLNSYYHFLNYVTTNHLDESRIQNGEILVKENEVFLAGDNYDSSYDCFSSGPINANCIVGRVDIVVEKDKNLVLGAVKGIFKLLF